MTQEQFDRETDFRLAYALFKSLLTQGLLTEKELAAARKKLIERFNPPIASLTDVLSAQPC